jgi:hypothetical protein
MDHIVFPPELLSVIRKRKGNDVRIMPFTSRYLSVRILTFLICYSTGSFAGGLAGCLAFSAASLDNAFL